MSLQELVYMGPNELVFVILNPTSESNLIFNSALLLSIHLVQINNNTSTSF